MIKINQNTLAAIFSASIPVLIIETFILISSAQNGTCWFSTDSLWLAGLSLSTYSFLTLIFFLIIIVLDKLHLLNKINFLSKKLNANLRLRRFSQLIISLIVIVVTFFLIRYFNKTFHDPEMIKWALFIIIGTIIWVTVSCCVIIEKNAGQGKLNLKPILIPGYAIAVAFLFNLTWIKLVIDLYSLGFLLIWLLLSWKLHLKWINMDLHTSTVLTPICIMSLLFPVLAAGSSHLLPVIKNHSILIKYPVKFIHKSPIYKYLPFASHQTDVTEAILPENFDVNSWNKNNIQDFSFDSLRPNPFKFPITSSWNVVFLTIEATRADHVSCYGYEYPTTPNLDNLASSGVMFERNYTQGGDSIFSLNSILSGVLPWHYRDRKDPMLGTILQQHGIATGYIGYDYVLKGGAFLDGFEYKKLLPGKRNDVWGKTTSKQLVDEIILMIQSLSEQQFFVYSHLLDPHADYVKNSETDKFSGSKHQAYDAEIAYTDLNIGRLIKFLEESDLIKNTVIIITADHGEEFKEHGHLWHGRFLYDESIHTPLIMSLPEISGRRVKLPVGPVNIAPTVLSIMGVSPLATMDGLSLLPLIYEGNTDRLPIVEMYIPSEDNSKHGWVYGPWKLIENKTDGSKELYHLGNDPKELRNLISSWI